MKIQLDNIEKELREEGYLVNLYQDDEDYYLRVGKRISDDELPMGLIPSVPIGRVSYFDSKYHFRFNKEAKYEIQSFQSADALLQFLIAQYPL